MSRGERKSACPPSCQAPTSKETRVRVDAFMKIIASDFPASGFAAYAPVRMRSARSKRPSSSSRLKSGMARKSRWDMGRSRNWAPGTRNRGTAPAKFGRTMRESEEGHESRVTVDRKSTRLNSSHGYISYAVFCLKKKKKKKKTTNE